MAGQLSSRPITDYTLFLWCFRYIDRACEIWEEILYDHPMDAFTLRLLQNGYYFLGANEAMRDSVARVIPLWSPSRPHYGYLLGIYSFGLCETGDTSKALSTAYKVYCCYMELYGTACMLWLPSVKPYISQSCHDRAQDSLTPGGDNQVVRENVGWSRSPRAQGCPSDACLECWIGQHGRRYDPSTERGREREREPSAFLAGMLCLFRACVFQ